MKEDDLVANTILEKASDWTSPKPLLMALLQRLIQEMSLPFANQIIIAALKHDQGNLQFGQIIFKACLAQLMIYVLEIYLGKYLRGVGSFFFRV